MRQTRTIFRIHPGGAVSSPKFNLTCSDNPLACDSDDIRESRIHHCREYDGMRTAPALKLWVYDLPPSRNYGATGRANKHFTLKENPLKRSDLDAFVACYKPKNRHKFDRLSAGSTEKSPSDSIPTSPRRTDLRG